MLKIYALYRFITASLFVMLFYLRFGPSLLGSYSSPLYQFASLAYLGISLFVAPFAIRSRRAYAPMAQISIFTDIVFITLLMHASGGVGSGIGILLAITIAAGGLLIGGRCAMLFAALASLAILAEEIYSIEIHAFENTTLTYAGMLGVSFFSIAFLSVILAQRAEQSASLAQRHEQTIARLEALNRYIIQHLQSGIMIVDAQQTTQLSNQSALRLLGLTEQANQIADISSELKQAFEAWRLNPDQDFAIIRTPGCSEIQVRFSALTIDNEILHMLIFEDIALHNQRLQQSKLASLGRLTASIAHEIRNPLSAISHAGQLLSEAPELKRQELRLTEIIRHHCQRVNNIIEDILKLSRRKPSQKQKIVLEHWLPAYLQEQKLNLGPQAAAFALRINGQGLNVFVDSGHLKQILDNLCANALTYGKPERGKIILEAGRLQDTPYIKIIDNGDVISAEDRQHLFEPFFTTSHNGTGLGLYISRELAELNQAELSYAGQPGKPCFVLLLANADHAIIEI